MLTQKAILQLTELHRKADRTSGELSHEINGYHILATKDDRIAMDKKRGEIHALLDTMLDDLDTLAKIRRENEL